MRLYPFSALILLVLCWGIIADWNRGIKSYFRRVFLFYIIVTVFTNIGNFVEIGSFGLTNRAFLSIFVFLIALLVILIDKDFDRRIIRLGALFYLSVIIGYVGLCVLPYKLGVIHELSQWDAFVADTVDLDYNLAFNLDFEMLFKIIHFPIVLAVAFRCFSDKRRQSEVLDILAFISSFAVAYGLVELLMIKLAAISPYEYLLEPIFGNSDATFQYTDRLQGFFKEASHYAGALFVWGIINILYIRRAEFLRAKRIIVVLSKVRFALTLLLMVASTSFVGLLYVVLLFAAYLVYCSGFRFSTVIIAFIVLCLLGSAILFSGALSNISFVAKLQERVAAVIETFERLFAGEKGPVSSEGARFTSIFYMLKIIIMRPLFGIGAGITDAHSTLFASVANLGIVGFALMALMYIGPIKIKKCHIPFYVIFVLYFAFAGSFGAIFDFQYPFVLFLAGKMLSGGIYPVRYIDDERQNCGYLKRL